MSVARIQSALEKAFSRQRVVFWYDETGEWWPELDGVQLAGVEKVAVQNNEFTVKHRIAREAPRQKFLLYFRSPQPADTANWLLDQLLAHGPAFSPDRASLARIEAGLPPEFKPLTEQHLEFFQSTERVARLNDWRKPDDTERAVRLKMLAVVCRAEPTIEGMLLALFSDLARDKSDRWGQVEKFALAETWWREVGAHFGYVAGAPTLLDFLLALFRAVAPFGTGSALDARQALLFVNRWQDSQEHRETFATLSERAEELLNITAALNQMEDVRPLLTCDLYRRIDLRLLADLRDALVAGTLPPAEVRQRAEAREQMHWARHDAGIKSLYRALALAAQLVETLPKLDLTIESFDAGLEKYAGTWCQVDQLYRQFIHAYCESGQTALLEQLAARIEGLYVNEYLSQLAQRWQEWLDRSPAWASSATPGQREFFARFVQPQVAEGRKVFVIVSDALRYEAGRELVERIRREDRWTAEVKPMLGVLPSFTQLGMAALLPHTALEFSPDGKTVVADCSTTAGAEARANILAAHASGRATAITAEAFLLLNSKTDGRELSRANEVVFIYHNAIDAVGDTRDTEHKTCAAVETALQEIVKLLKKAAAMNVSHFLVTADHGFLYQHTPVAESDFLALAEPPGTLKYDRRFLVAPVLPEDARLKRFTAAQLGLASSLQFGFPKGIQRLRLQGSGSRYVHGGASLQEIVLPAIEVKKERTSDVGQVEVDILRSGQQITTGQVAITFLQNEPADEKCLPREVRVGFFSRTGVPLSDTKALKFDSPAEDARQRERREQFVFGRQADQFNQQEVVLRLETPVAGTAQFALYREFIFKLRRAFESDFDDL
jgi:uncharacterized protein (TIGR02687 family)